MLVGCGAAVGVCVSVCQLSAFPKWIILNHCCILCWLQLVIVVTQAWRVREKGADRGEGGGHKIEREMDAKITSLLLPNYCKPSSFETFRMSSLCPVRNFTLFLSAALAVESCIWDYQEPKFLCPSLPFLPWKTRHANIPQPKLDSMIKLPMQHQLGCHF